MKDRAESVLNHCEVCERPLHAPAGRFCGEMCRIAFEIVFVDSRDTEAFDCSDEDVTPAEHTQNGRHDLPEYSSLFAWETDDLLSTEHGTGDDRHRAGESEHGIRAGTESPALAAIDSDSFWQDSIDETCFRRHDALQTYPTSASPSIAPGETARRKVTSHECGASARECGISASRGVSEVSSHTLGNASVQCDDAHVLEAKYLDEALRLRVRVEHLERFGPLTSKYRPDGDGVLWRLRVAITNLGFTEIKAYRAKMILALLDSEGYEFRPFTHSQHEFDEASGAQRFADTTAVGPLQPKVSVSGAILFLLPDQPSQYRLVARDKTLWD